MLLNVPLKNLFEDLSDIKCELKQVGKVKVVEFYMVCPSVISAIYQSVSTSSGQGSLLFQHVIAEIIKIRKCRLNLS